MWAAIASAAGAIAADYLQNKTRNQEAQREYDHQKEFAQNGIRWRVADAKAAGIHPIFAIGANTPTYSPQAAVGTDYGLSSVGQNIGRAIEAKQTRNERLAAQRLTGRVAESQANYYDAAAANQLAQAELAGQRSLLESQSYNGNSYVENAAILSERATRTQSTQRQPSMPEVSTYNTPKPGIDPYIIGNTYFEAPPENIADMVENPALFAGWKGVIEAAEVLDGKVKQDFMKILLPSHRKLINAGTHEIIRVRGIGFAVKRKGDPLKPSDFGLNSRRHHVGGPYNIY